MRRVIAVLSVMAIAILAANAVQATDYWDTAPTGTAYFDLNNTDNGDWEWYAPSNSPTATSQGLLWEKTTATGTPAYLDPLGNPNEYFATVNLQLNWRLNSGSSWYTIALLTGSDATNDMSYAGYFTYNGQSNATNYFQTGSYGGFCLPGSRRTESRAIPVRVVCLDRQRHHLCGGGLARPAQLRHLCCRQRGIFCQSHR